MVRNILAQKKDFLLGMKIPNEVKDNIDKAVEKRGVKSRAALLLPMIDEFVNSILKED